MDKLEGRKIEENRGMKNNKSEGGEKKGKTKYWFSP